MIILKENVENLVEIINISTKQSQPMIFPTDTIYGVGASINNIEANKKIYNIKKRPYSKPFPILAGSIEQVELIADLSTLTKECYLFFKENYNNFTTFIINSKNTLNPLFQNNGKVAVRIPNKEILQKALIKSNQLITATSVNESGNDFLNNLQDIIKSFDIVNLFISGKQLLNQSSNIYDISEKNIIKIR